MIRRLTFLVLSICPNLGFGQKISIEIRPQFNGHTIHLGDTIINTNNNSTIVISTLRFYVGQFELIDSQNQKSLKHKEYYLVDLALPESMHISFDSNFSFHADFIEFNYGVDSLTNTSGALSGALDPTNGMYWAWQSGYINMKLEGYIISGLNNKVKFEYHLGGFLSPFENSQIVRLNLPAKSKIVIVIDLDKFFSDTIERKEFRIMSPSLKAKELSKTAAQSFRINNEK
jgi:hypothetical protein